MSQIAGKIAKRDLTAVQRVLPLYQRTKQMGAIFKAKEGTMKIPMLSHLFSREIGLKEEMKVNHVSKRTPTPIDSLNEKLELEELASSENAQTEGGKRKRRKSLTDIIFGSKN